MSVRQAIITRSDGTKEPFDRIRLESSLARAGAPREIRERIAQHISDEIADGMTTGRIYQHAFDMLKEKDAPHVAARYSLRRAIFALGPSGYPFERFLAEVLKAHGYKTQTGLAMNGRCAPHEVDVLAEKDGRRIGIEAKFHNVASVITDIKDALYVRARFEDLDIKIAPQGVHEGWLVTNTRFTRNAIRYARCSGLGLLGWDYPQSRGLETLIEEAGVHPLTCLTTLTDGEKARLIEKNVVLCKTIKTSHSILEESGVKPSKIPDILKEAENVCIPSFNSGPYESPFDRSKVLPDDPAESDPHESNT